MKHIILIISTLSLSLYSCIAQQFQFNTLTSDVGLAHNTVLSITQDYKGFMWFGTRDGLSRYDSQRLKNYYFKNTSPRQETNTVNCLYSVREELWVGTKTGLFRYLIDKDRFEEVILTKGSTFVSGIQRMSNGELWVNGQDGIYILEQRGQVRHILPAQNIHSVSEFRKGTYLILENNKPRLINAEGDTVLEIKLDDIGLNRRHTIFEYDLYKDKLGVIWLGTNVGLMQLDEKMMQFQPVDWFNRLTNSRMWLPRTITEDHLGNLWVGSESGLVVVDKTRQTAQWYDKSFTKSPFKLNDRAIYASYVSRDGTVWIGTYFGGVNYAKPVNTSFRHLFAGSGGQSIAGNAVSQLAIDTKERLWIATEDAGVTILDLTSNHYTYYNQNNGLSDNNIHSIWIDKSGVAWIGTLWGGVNRIDPVSGAILVYRHQPADSASLSNNAVHTIFRDRTNILWVGTVKGLNILDEKTGQFRLFKPEVLAKTFIYEIREDATGQLWMATRSDGIYCYNKNSKKLTHYTAENTPAIKSDQIISIYIDSKQTIWFGSINGGVCVWSNVLKKFVSSPVNTQLPNPTVYGVLEDNQGTYWFSTNKGLLSFDPKQRNYYHFNKSNGLQTTQFNFKSFSKDKKGILYFGSVDGLCYFNTEQVKKQIFDPPVYFTDLKLFNKSVSVGSESLLLKHIDETKIVSIDYSQNVITLDFIAINYFAKGNSYYTYYLEGFEPSWNPKTTVSSRTYTNLSPGNYTFHVRSFRSNGELSSAQRAVQLIIKPPFWQTPYAYLVYLLLGVIILLAYRRFINFFNQQKVAVQLEQVERQKSEEMNQQKLNFFTFLSNEFKTPITLIMAEVDELMQSNRAWQTDSATHYGVIKKNAKQLRTLIDQITELRKTGHELQRIHLTEQDVVAFVKEIVRGFAPLFQERHIHKQLTFSFPYLMASFDARKLEMIISSMLSFLTNELVEGNELNLAVSVDQKAAENDCSLVFNFLLNDNPKLLQRLEASYRVAQHSNELFGQNDPDNIGIMMTFGLLKQIPGSVVFTNDTDKQGFCILFLVRKSPANKTDKIVRNTHSMHNASDSDLVDTLRKNSSVSPLPDKLQPFSKPTLLIIDKSKDLVYFLKRHFQNDYRIIMPSTFDEAISKLENSFPDLVLCDCEIRNKQNNNLCTVIKSKPETRTIPVILLLNDNDEKTVIEGLNSGADAYISKPFNLNELDLMITNNLKSILALKNQLMHSLPSLVLTPLPQHNKEQDFVMRFYALVHQHYKDKDITTDILAQRMNCSRSQLHAKLRTLTGLSPKEYLNNYRLSLGCQLLESGMSVSEVTFEVGFGNPSYFGRAFKKKFGKTPARQIR